MNAHLSRVHGSLKSGWFFKAGPLGDDRDKRDTLSRRLRIAGGALKTQLHGLNIGKGNMTRRFFALEGESFHYYRDEDRRRLMGSIDLSTVERVVETSRPIPSGIDIITPSRTYTIAPCDETMQGAWVAVLSDVAARSARKRASEGAGNHSEFSAASTPGQERISSEQLAGRTHASQRLGMEVLGRAASQMLADLPPPRSRISCIKPHLSRWQSLSGNTPKPAMSFAYDLNLFFTPAGSYVTGSLREGGRHLPRVVDALHGTSPDAARRWEKRRRHATAVSHSPSALGLASGRRRNGQRAHARGGAPGQGAATRSGELEAAAEGGQSGEASAAAESTTPAPHAGEAGEGEVSDDELLSTSADEDEEEDEDEGEGEDGRDCERGAAAAGGEDSSATGALPAEDGAFLPPFVVVGGAGRVPTGKFEVDVPWLDPASHAMLAVSDVRWYPPGRVIYAEGDVAESALLVLEGSMAVYYSVHREGSPVGPVTPEAAIEEATARARVGSDAGAPSGAGRSGLDSQRFPRASWRGVRGGEAARSPAPPGGAAEGGAAEMATPQPCNPYQGEVVRLATLFRGNWVGEATLLDPTAPAYWPFTVVTLETAAVMSVSRQRLGEQLAAEVPPASAPLPPPDELPPCLRGAAAAKRLSSVAERGALSSGGGRRPSGIEAAAPTHEHGSPASGAPCTAVRRRPSAEARLRASLSLAPRALVGRGWTALAGPSLLSMGQSGSAAHTVAPGTPPLLAGESDEARDGRGRPSLAERGPAPRPGATPALPYAVHRASAVLPGPEARPTDALRLLCGVGLLRRLLRTQDYCVYPLHDPANPGVMDFTAPPSPEALVCSLCECLRFPAGAQVCVAGEPADALFVVLRGCLVTSVADPGAAERRQFALRRGDYLGDHALMGNTTWRTSVKAVEPTVLIVLAADRFRQVVAVFPELWEPACREAQQAAEDWRRNMETRLLDVTSASGAGAS